MVQIAAEVPQQVITGEIGRTLAEMELGCPPAVTRALYGALGGGELGYLAAADVAQLQDAVGGWLADAYGWEPQRAAIRPVSDLVAGFRAVLTHLLPAGQPIIVPTPGYMPFISMPGQIDHPVIEVPMLRDAGGWHYDFEALRAAFAAGARLLVLCNPHNPIGKVATAAELDRIEELVAEYDGIVFSDEIHAPLVLGERQHTVYAARSARAAAHTITATSATKAFNIPGTKCGQLVFTNPDHLARWLEIGHWHEHQTSVLGVVATSAAYGGGREWLAETVAYLRGTIAEAVALLDAAAARTGIRVIRPDATYLLWLDLSETALLRDDVSAAQAVREAAGLVVTDGSECGAAGRGAVRFNAALPRPVTLEAMRRLIAAAESAGTQRAHTNRG
ncbi:MalY/PatB family protein [Leucobacter luti]|uniref:MalY/PatB family protein n=1 Tax=Leucobacter luti TaxID=340320 RepID=UPI0013007CF5|nr:aminotransferase class I/II-fold pyridoxal phosphate-dependent enzyme [Leucobacter luti]